MAITTVKLDTTHLFMGICTVVSVGIAWYAVKRAEEDRKYAQDKINEVTEAISDGVPVDISNDIIDAAVNSAVEKAVSKEVNKACANAVNAVRAEISNDINAIVKKTMGDLSDAVTEEAQRQVDNLDISSLQEKVLKRAEKKVEKKMDDALSEVSKKFSGDLDSIGKIYRSIAETMTDKAGFSQSNNSHADLKRALYMSLL